ncbi:MAG: membrane protein insertion efficiency factor YidD [Candidatus Cloacimonadota bacterium]|nr:membrane protein insertion efficiency factor YidD [candidate division WOR-3 bacterium]TET76335.1 MAG: membrane protein insertion efficiency factor YidD [Candidatus Cloacimonadota bacterium]
MKTIVILFIKTYKQCISPIFPKTCRFYPSCSTYCLTAIEKYGLIRGVFKGLLRILRCNPLYPGGYDPVE